MEYPKYEKLSHIDPTFPVIYHLDHLEEDTRVYTHWHGAVEILYFLSGSATVRINAQKIEAKQNDVVIIDASSIHQIEALSPKATYFCLIIDDDFCADIGFPVSDISFEALIRNEKISDLYMEIINEIKKEDTYSKAAAKGYINIFLAEIFRGYVSHVHTAIASGQPDKIETVKNAIRFIHKNYSRFLTVEAVAQHCHISKFYFCRIFKELTGATMISYVNSLRCLRAKELLTEGGYSVSAAARSCGFDNLSYFAKTYKKYMGSLPSDIIKNVN